MTTTWALSGDLSRSAIIGAVVLAVLSTSLLVVELARAQRRPLGTKSRARDLLLIGASGLSAIVGLLLAVLRPVAVAEQASLVGPRVIVLADASRSVDLPGIVGTRRKTLEEAVMALGARSDQVRLSVLSFGMGAPVPTAEGSGPQAQGASPFTLRARPTLGSDLIAALEAIGRAADERPSAIVVLSDGRFTRPADVGTAEATTAALGTLRVPIHTVALATDAPTDAAILRVVSPGAAVAHQPFSLRVEIACTGGLRCGDIPVVARELREKGGPVTLAEGVAHVTEGHAEVDLTMTIERAGSRIVEVAITAPEGDTIPENNRRFLSLNVGRDRVRVLHVAGRPTYDVRALRMWLKSDASVDLVAFFILRGPKSDVHAPISDLSLIRFPVHELFTEQLPTFDAIVLQDFNAVQYELAEHLRGLAKYVSNGGGLIMVGGADSFVGGHYAGSPLSAALPVELDNTPGALSADITTFTPVVTPAGRSAPVLAPLRALIGNDLPDMPGANILGDAKPGATVLMTHPTRKTPKGQPMPVLAVGEYGSGRTIALAIDGSHRLMFSNFAEKDAGRAHGAFWDAMLGWLMRDPRFEPAVVELREGCIAGVDTTLTLRPLIGQVGSATVDIRRLGDSTVQVVKSATVELDGSGKAVDLAIGKLDEGGFTAAVRIDLPGSRGTTTQRDFACEAGGDEWADSRPDLDRLAAIAKATGGRHILPNEVRSLPLPQATRVASERHVRPLLPAWVWALGAASLLGLHWIIRRLLGLA